MRVVRAFAREEYEQRRYEVESMESVGMALRARGLKAKLSPLVEMIVAWVPAWCSGLGRAWFWTAASRQAR